MNFIEWVYIGVMVLYLLIAAVLLFLEYVIDA